MTEVRVSERSYLDIGEAVDRSSDKPMDMAMEMAKEVTSFAAETAGKATVEPRVRNKNRNREQSEVSATARALGDWPSHTERAAQKQARKLAQPHGTISMMVHMLETQTALQEVQWCGMKMCLE